MKEFFNTSSNPVGHGFNWTDANKGFACYSFVPKSTIPIKVIVLDDTQREDDGSADIHGHGFLDQARWDWLKKELADGAGCRSAHDHRRAHTDKRRSDWADVRNRLVGRSSKCCNPLPNLIGELQRHPNLIMWISGHRHLNTIKAFISPDPVNAPENGFWEVETSSLRDFPSSSALLRSTSTVTIQFQSLRPTLIRQSKTERLLRHRVHMQLRQSR